MCGIVGYIGKNKASEILIRCLKNLEYRGYDSTGIALLNNKIIKIIKGVGKVNDVFSEDTSKLDGNIGIAHSRWATHGKVTASNAHPHTSNDEKIAVVHNGIIENYQELKSNLEKEGYKFKSETDTEVIPILIQKYKERGKSDEEAIKLTIKQLKGSFALGILFQDEEKLFAVKKESPLVVGVAKDGFFIASDIPSFIEYTKNVVFLQDYDLVTLTYDNLSIFNIEEDIPVKRPINTIQWDLEQVQKGNFEHFMIKEILEQVEITKKIFNQEEKFFEIAQIISKAKEIYLIAAGSSFHACLTAKYLFSKIAKIKVNLCLASEFKQIQDFINKDSLVIAVSQSGETADVLSAVKIAKEREAKIIAITNNQGSSLIRYSDQYILQNAGPELCVLATKTYTSQLIIFLMLVYTLAQKYEEGKDKLFSLTRHIYNLTSENTRNAIKNLAEKLRHVNHIYLIGRDLQYPTALEAALKIKEATYIHAEGFAGGELKHGSIALIEFGTPCIVFLSKETENEIISNATELKARGAYLIGVGPEKNPIFDFFIKVREAEESNPICQIIPIQILAYQLAILRGHNPDKPRNLAKSVTVK